MIAAALLAIAGLLCPRIFRNARLPRPVVALLTAIAAWTAITTLTSTDRIISLMALAHVVAALVVFYLCVIAVSRRNAGVMYFVFAPGLIHSVAAILQAMHIWDPWGRDFATLRRNDIGAFLGNPDDVGTFLVPLILAATALALTSARHRLLSCLVAVICVAGMIATQTVTAAGALAVGLFVVLASVGRRGLIVAAIAAPLGLVALLSADRLTQVIHFSTAGRYDALLSGRLPPFAAAWTMFTSSPVVGVGPGCFPRRYFATKLSNEERYPGLILSASRTTNFGETHNDQLQLLAEGGLPALLLFYAGLIFLFGRPPSREAGERARFAFLLGRGTATALFVLTLAQFPLHLTSSVVTLLVLTAISVQWRMQAS